jgi:hypothetical protein
VRGPLGGLGTEPADDERLTPEAQRLRPGRLSARVTARIRQDGR